MTRRERVLCAINHQQPDRVPLDYRGTPEVDDMLTNHFGADYLERLGVDIRLFQPEYIGPPLPTYDDGRVANEFGMVRKPVRNQAGTYMEVCELIYENLETVAEVESFTPWPDVDWYDFSALAQTVNADQQHAVCVGGTGVLDLINNISFGRGIERVYEEIATDGEVFLALIKKRAQFFLRKMEQCLDACGGRIDIIFFGDDLGTQNGPLISPNTYRRMFMPYHQQMIDLAHNYGAKAMMHCCGGTKPLFPVFLDMGLDVYQTVQPEAAGMDPYELKADFGERIAFNGTMANQSTFPFGTPQEVRVEARERIDRVGAGGGLILGPSHNFQPDVPLENILAMYDEALA